MPIFIVEQNVMNNEVTDIGLDVQQSVLHFTEKRLQLAVV